MPYSWIPTPNHPGAGCFNHDLIVAADALRQEMRRRNLKKMKLTYLHHIPAAKNTRQYYEARQITFRLHDGGWLSEQDRKLCHSNLSRDDVLRRIAPLKPCMAVSRPLGALPAVELYRLALAVFQGAGRHVQPLLLDINESGAPHHPEASFG